jgi:hypothetical protein
VTDTTPTLQERAREIAAGLTGRRADALIRIVRTDGCFVRRHTVQAAKWLAARELAVVTDNGYMRCNDERWYVTPTDLGRAVAAVLAEGGAA